MQVRLGPFPSNLLTINRLVLPLVQPAILNVLLELHQLSGLLHVLPILFQHCSVVLLNQIVVIRKEGV